MPLREQLTFMKAHLARLSLGTLLCASTAFAIDDFNIQMSKLAHEETSWRHDVYTIATSAELWKSECPWLQKPAVTLRFNAMQQERGGGFYESELLAPMFDVSFQTFGGVNVGIAYQHGFLSEDFFSTGVLSRRQVESDLDSIGGYLTKQWDCGFNVGATWAYSRADIVTGFGPFGEVLQEFDTVGASGTLGFARSFGEKKFGRNVFIDTSANFLYQSEEEAWYFLWMAKAGHNICPRVAVFGIFNLFHVLDYNGHFSVPIGFAGYGPIGDETWGEAGGGIQAQLPWGISMSAEVTTPVLDEGFIAQNAYQVRAALNWRF
jgi:hypothetical protein